MHLSFDSEVSRWRYADFSFTRLKSVYKSKVGEDFAGLDFLSFDLVNGDRLTNAARYLRMTALFAGQGYSVFGGMDWIKRAV
uniref:hypothetical protein n=1 Tax=Dialister sp. TaxID=1955814 RepID=UPI0040294587